MPAWEYKFITSGKGGFATPALLESFLNQLGQDEWEILYVQAQPENPLAFNGLARRATQREWTLENAVTAAARAEADKLRAEFEAKFRGGAGAAESDKPSGSEPAEPEAGGIRRLRDTERDLDPELADEEEADEWDKISQEDELPTFFEAIQPLMRRNQRGEGVSVGVDHLARKWHLSVDDVVAALKECGFTVPEDEDSRPSYVEYEGDLFWVNVNRRGELWINSREKPRPVFRTVSGKAVTPEAEAAAAPAAAGEVAADLRAAEVPRPEIEGHPSQRADDRGPHQQSKGLPEGPGLLEKIRPQMRRDRGGSGRSGSVGFLSRALRCRESEMIAALEALGLKLAGEGEAPVEIEATGGSWSLSRDHRGGIWIHQRKTGKTEEGAAEAVSPEAQPAEAPGAETPGPAGAGPSTSLQAAGESRPPGSPVLAGARLLLKATRTGALASEIGRLAEAVGRSPEDFIRSLVEAGLAVPEKPREKPVFVEQGGEIFWLNRNAKGELWLNAKAAGGSRRQSRQR